MHQFCLRNWSRKGLLFSLDCRTFWKRIGEKHTAWLLIKRAFIPEIKNRWQLQFEKWHEKYSQKLWKGDLNIHIEISQIKKTCGRNGNPLFSLKDVHPKNQEKCQFNLRSKKDVGILRLGKQKQKDFKNPLLRIHEKTCPSLHLPFEDPKISNSHQI